MAEGSKLEDSAVMSLASPNSSFNRGPHLAVVVAVVLFPLTHFLENLSVDLGPEIVCYRFLILHIIIAQHTELVKFSDCANDLLKSPVNPGPRLINFGFRFVQLHVVRRGFHVRKFLM